MAVIEIQPCVITCELRIMGVEMKKKSMIQSEKGQATFEVVPLLAIFVLFIGYGMGAFGIVHTGILHNIAARTYAFETFRHRTNLAYFRENRISPGPEHYRDFGIRIHAIKHESSDGGEYVYATERQISFGFPNEIVGRSPRTHEDSTREIRPGQRATGNVSVNPAWVKVQYGICINATCGDNSGDEG